MTEPADLYVAMPWHGVFAGGASAALTSIAHAIRRCGFRVSILTSCSKSPYEDWQRSVHAPGTHVEDGLEVTRFPVDRVENSGYHAAVRRRLDGVDVEPHLQEAFFEQGLNSSPLVDFVGTVPTDTPVLVGPYYQSITPSLVNRYPGRITVMPAFHDEPEMRWAPIVRMAQNAKRFLFLSEEEKSLATLCHGVSGGRRLIESEVVGLGVSLPPRLREPVALMRASLTAKERRRLPERYFLYCGRIEAAKGLDKLIPRFDAWASFRQRIGDEMVPLVVLGEGDRKLLPDSPHFVPLGFVEAEEKFALMRGAVALVNPSRLESFSYVVMESWLAGRPVAVPAQCAVTAGHVRRSGGGAIYHDEASFRSALELLLEDATADALGESGKRYVEASYGWPEVLDRLLDSLGMVAR